MKIICNKPREQNATNKESECGVKMNYISADQKRSMMEHQKICDKEKQEKSFLKNDSIFNQLIVSNFTRYTFEGLLM